MPLKILFCDDDPAAIAALNSAVLEYFASSSLPAPECVLCTSGDELLDLGEGGDIAFLDVEMPGLSGIVTGQRLKLRNPRIKIIIVTSYPDYLDEAMRFEVFRYLSKPVSPARLSRALKDAIYQISVSSRPVFIDTDEGGVTLEAEDIICVESKGRRSVFYTSDREIRSPLGIEHWAAVLDLPCFYIAHRSNIVNLRYVSGFTADSVTLSRGEFIKEAYLAKRKFRDFRAAYLSYMETIT